MLKASQNTPRRESVETLTLCEIFVHKKYSLLGGFFNLVLDLMGKFWWKTVGAYHAKWGSPRDPGSPQDCPNSRIVGGVCARQMRSTICWYGPPVKRGVWKMWRLLGIVVWPITRFPGIYVRPCYKDDSFMNGTMSGPSQWHRHWYQWPHLGLDYHSWSIGAGLWESGTGIPGTKGCWEWQCLLVKASSEILLCSGALPRIAIDWSDPVSAYMLIITLGIGSSWAQGGWDNRDFSKPHKSLTWKEGALSKYKNGVS